MIIQHSISSTLPELPPDKRNTVSLGLLDEILSLKHSEKVGHGAELTQEEAKVLAHNSVLKVLEIKALTLLYADSPWIDERFSATHQRGVTLGALGFTIGYSSGTIHALRSKLWKVTKDTAQFDRGMALAKNIGQTFVFGNATFDECKETKQLPVGGKLWFPVGLNIPGCETTGYYLPEYFQGAWNAETLQTLKGANIVGEVTSRSELLLHAVYTGSPPVSRVGKLVVRVKGHKKPVPS